MAENLYRLTAIIVDNEMGSRMRLKEATTTLPFFSSVLPLGSLREALGYLKDGETSYDLIFVSHHFPREEALGFVREGKNAKHGQDSAYVLLVKSLEGSNMAANLMAGFDGILSEPYSINSLNEMVHLATGVKGERSAARERIAMQLLLTDLTKQLDLVAFLKSCGYETTKSLNTLKEMASGLNALSPTSLEGFKDLATKVFSECAPPQFQVPPAKKYGGVSKRVRERMASKITGVVDFTSAGSKKP